jgi:hypothetical protein
LGIEGRFEEFYFSKLSKFHRKGWVAGIMDDMLKHRPRLRLAYFGMIFLILFLSACSNGSSPTEPVATLAPEDLYTATPDLPTPTPVPAIAVVNGERVPLAWYETEVSRYLIAQEALGTPVTDMTAARETVLNDVVEKMLLAQGAVEAGFTVTDADVQAKIDALAAEVDLATWMGTWGYTEADLFQSMRLDLLATDQRDRITGTVPTTMEQVELRQVFAYTATGAQNALASLNTGTPFEDVAYEYDWVAGGYLGWVPRGYLLIPAVEDVAFNLAVGSRSDIIESDIGYHIVMVLDRAERPLSSDALQILQHQALQNWVTERLAASSVEILGN